MKPKISIIIPTYNEEKIIHVQLKDLLAKINNDCEVIVVDASEDTTAKLASRLPVKLIYSEKGRAIQMNRGAEAATGDILFFVHIDTHLPESFTHLINSAVQKGASAGCFQMEFDDDHWLMQFYGWCTRFSSQLCRGGDQTLFVKKELFNNLKGYNESMLVMEDIEIISRIKKTAGFIILSNKVVTSARKYKDNGRIRLQLIFGLIHMLYFLDFSQKSLLKIYRKIR